MLLHTAHCSLPAACMQDSRWHEMGTPRKDRPLHEENVDMGSRYPGLWDQRSDSTSLLFHPPGQETLWSGISGSGFRPVHMIVHFRLGFSIFLPRRLSRKNGKNGDLSTARRGSGGCNPTPPYPSPRNTPLTTPTSSRSTIAVDVSTTLVPYFSFPFILFPFLGGQRRLERHSPLLRFRNTQKGAFLKKRRHRALILKSWSLLL